MKNNKSIPLGSEDYRSRFEKDYMLLKKKISGLVTQENFIEDKANYQKVMNIVAENFPGKPQENFSKISIHHLVEQFKNVAIMNYLYMQKSNDYGIVGEQQISISFCRIILKIPTDKEITQEDADNFANIIEDYDNKSGNKTANEYLTMAGEYELDFYGKKIIFKNIQKIVPYLDFMKIKIFLYSKLYKQPDFILGKAKKLHINQHEVFIIKKELIRSPDMHLSIAGRKGDVTIVRKESCEVIFLHKWDSFYDYPLYYKERALSHPDSAISRAIQNKALSLYDINNNKDILKRKKLFIEEMIDGVLWHEMGHVTGGNEIDLAMETMQASLDYPEFAITVLGEVIADWAPEQNGGKGAFARFLEIAKTDINRAQREIYVYLSDIWFDDEKYSLRNDVLTGLAVSFIENDGSVNFDKINKEINKIFQFTIKSMEYFFEQILQIYKTEVYTIYDDKLKIKGDNISHDDLDKAMLEMFKESKKEMSMEELYRDGDFWDKKLEYLQKNTPNGQKRLDSLPETFAHKLRLDVLKYVTENHPEKYNNSLLEYIYARYREIGMLVDYKKIINDVFKKMKLTNKVKERVQRKIKYILSGMDSFIPAEGKPSPFVNFIQEILLKTNPVEMRGPVERGYPDDTTLKTIKIINLAIRPDDVTPAFTIDDFFLENIFLAYQNGYYPGQIPRFR